MNFDCNRRNVSFSSGLSFVCHELAISRSDTWSEPVGPTAIFLRLHYRGYPSPWFRLSCCILPPAHDFHFVGKQSLTTRKAHTKNSVFFQHPFFQKQSGSLIKLFQFCFKFPWAISNRSENARCCGFSPVVAMVHFTNV